ncbi:MAG: acyltransferase [Bacteroidales bacterium]|nr:acyltransferase [Bacteroidales bacterium]
MISEFNARLRILLFLPWSIVFNFHYLPFKQACKLPIVFYVLPTFLTLKGKIIIDSPIIRFNMIQFGKCKAPIVSYRSFRWENRGTVIFNGRLEIAHHAFVSCGRDGILQFGDYNRFNFGCRIISYKEIVFGDKVRVSWDCTFLDTDYHPLIDTVRGKPLKVFQSIRIDYGCWIGHNCIISKGVKLPKNTTVCAGAIVKGRFSQENTIIGGNIAKVLDEGYVRDDV